MAILEAKGVTKRFGGLTAVSNFDVEVEERSIHSIIGPNGAGKTTFFNCITGFYNHEEGTILFEGEPIDGMPPDRITCEGIARTYQNIRLFPNMTVIENVLVGQHPHLHAALISGDEGVAHAPQIQVLHGHIHADAGRVNRLGQFAIWPATAAAGPIRFRLAEVDRPPVRLGALIHHRRLGNRRLAASQQSQQNEQEQKFP